MKQARKIEVVDYDPTWPVQFNALKSRLEPILQEICVRIEHIGSTSVPNLAAKPVIDVLLEVTSLTELDKKTLCLTALGLKAKGENGIPGRRYFQVGGNERTHHVHAFETGSEQLLFHRAFCAYSRAHPPITCEYAQVKRNAALNCHHDSIQYMALKNDFIQTQMPLAIAWFKSNT